jgi:hypothetical protein
MDAGYLVNSINIFINSINVFFKSINVFTSSINVFSKSINVSTSMIRPHLKFNVHKFPVNLQWRQAQSLLLPPLRYFAVSA